MLRKHVLSENSLTVKKKQLKAQYFHYIHAQDDIHACVCKPLTTMCIYVFIAACFKKCNGLLLTVLLISNVHMFTCMCFKNVIMSG